MPILDHFGLLAPYYDRAIPLREAEKFIEKIGLPVSGRILDVGGGTGRVAAALRGKASNTVVADLSYKMLSEAAIKGGLQLTCSHSEFLPFPGNSFERVIMVDAMHHVCDHAETAAELWRVLTPGGRIAILEPDIRKLSVKLVALAEKLVLMRSHFISPTAINDLFLDQRKKARIEMDGWNAWVIIDKPA